MKDDIPYIVYTLMLSHNITITTLQCIALLKSLFALMIIIYLCCSVID